MREILNESRLELMVNQRYSYDLQMAVTDKKVWIYLTSITLIITLLRLTLMA